MASRRMTAAPGTGPGCLGSPPQAPSSSLAGLEGAPRWLGVSKPSSIVRTESNVRRERPKRPDPPCTICKGTGRIDCRNCFGRGRINHADLVMLPNGEWPQWCRICGGSGLDYCLRCHGTGEYREPMGFHFIVQRKRGLECALVQCGWYQLRGHCSHSKHVAPVFQR